MNTFARRSLLAALLAAMFTNAAPADAAAMLRADGDRLTITPGVRAPGYQLRIIGPGPFLIEKTFLRNETMALQVGGDARWNDGAYTYEIAPIVGMEVRGGDAGGSRNADVAALEGGSFSIAQGRLLIPTSVPESQRSSDRDSAQAKDQVIPDDLIVQGSECVGLDCVDGESFGFDTIRMKENNLRVVFDDTSASAGFPATDWNLTANDSASGGINRFSIDDITAATTPFTVEGDTPTNSLYVDSTANVGLGTATPVLRLHAVRGDTPGVRLEQNGTGGFTPQTWDIAGNEANFFVRDVTGGSRLSFRIRPGAPTSSIDIAASGNVGIGTATPGASLDVARSGDTTLRISNLATSGFTNDWDWKNNAATGRLTLTDDPSGLRVPLKVAPNAVDNLLRIGVLATNTVDINGNLTVTGTITPDYVFEPKFDLPTIEQHAAAMWQNKHLPKVAPAATNAEGKGVIDVGARSQGLLEELEYAHIYIEQLHTRVQTLQRDDAAQKAELAQMRAMLATLERRIDGK
jgi:hypothetical protein